MLEPWMVDFLKKEEEKRRREEEAQRPQLPAPEDMPREFPEPEQPAKEQRGVVVIEP